jgi:hypothetical protein
VVVCIRLYSKKIKVPRNRPESPEGGRGIALHSLDRGTRRGGWSSPRPGRFTPCKDPVPIVQEAGWAPGPVWTCAENLTLTGIDYTIPTLKLIKARPLNSRLFHLPCNDMRSEYETFTSHTEAY